MSQTNLNNNLTDYLASLAKGVIGVFPAEFGSSIISEIVTSIIPNQRVDRIAKYCKELGNKLNAIPLEKLNALLIIHTLLT